jgi:hypothetical protein
MVIPTEMAMNDIDRFSHVVMAASPVAAPFGLTWAKLALLRLFADHRAQVIAPRPGASSAAAGTAAKRHGVGQAQSPDCGAASQCAAAV